MSFQIIIPSKTATNILPCINAIRAAGQTERVIVVDDGVEWGATRPDGVEVVPGIKPFIFSRNVNVGIRAAENDDVVVLNDDALLRTPHGFSELERLSKNDDIGIIGAVTNLTGQPLQWAKGIGLRQVPHFAFVCVYIPARTIERVGMLDERYCIDYGVEDRDYCEAVNRAGLKCAVHDGCYVDHGSLVSSFRGDPKAPKSFAENYKLFMAKWGIV